MWFTSVYSGPLQSVLLLLIYVQHIGKSEAEVQALYLVDEVIDFFLDGEDGHHAVWGKYGEAMQDQNEQQPDEAWELLRKMRGNAPTRSTHDLVVTPSLNPKDYRNPFRSSAAAKEDLEVFAPMSAPPEVNNVAPYTTKSQGLVSFQGEHLISPSHIPAEVDDDYICSGEDLSTIQDYSNLNAWSNSLFQTSQTNTLKAVVRSNRESTRATLNRARMQRQQTQAPSPKRGKLFNQNPKCLVPTLGSTRGTASPLSNSPDSRKGDSGRYGVGPGRMASGTINDSTPWLGGSHKTSDVAETKMNEDLWMCM